MDFSKASFVPCGFLRPDEVRFVRTVAETCPGCHERLKAGDAHMIEQPDGTFVCRVAMLCSYPSKRGTISSL